MNAGSRNKPFGAGIRAFFRKSSASVILGTSFLLYLSLFPSRSTGQDTIIQHYIHEGFENNLALKQKELNYNRSLQTLYQAKALFFPDLGFTARFTVADGGRTIDFPVGDLLNPVYTTLNQLTHSQQFPQVENEQIYFIRPTEQETKLTLRQPLFRPDILFNYKIQQVLSGAAFIDIKIYQRELVKEIKTAYYNYLKTVKAITLLEHTLELVGENVRVNESLYKNDKVTLDVVYRSRSERSKVERQLAEARDFHERAKSYFNFLLNKPLKSEIVETTGFHLPNGSILSEDSAMAIALANREELNQLDKYRDASLNSLKLFRFNKAPTLGVGVDYGIQGETYTFNDEADFLFASLVMQWSIFKGFENRSKIREATIRKDIIDEQYRETENKIRLQVTGAWYGEVTARETVAASLAENESATKAFELISKRYYQGQSSLLEFMDARTDMTSSGITLIIARYDYAISLAELERAMATYTY